MSDGGSGRYVVPPASTRVGSRSSNVAYQGVVPSSVRSKLRFSSDSRNHTLHRPTVVVMDRRPAVRRPHHRVDRQIVAAVDQKPLLRIGRLAVGQVEQTIGPANHPLQRPRNRRNLLLAGVAPVGNPLRVADEVLNRVSRHGEPLDLEQCGEYRQPPQPRSWHPLSPACCESRYHLGISGESAS